MSHPSLLTADAVSRFSEEARAAVYEAIALRRDVRHFEEGKAIDPGALERVLQAAHQAPSVGFSQPWGFVLVDDLEVRTRIRESFLRCRELEAARFTEERRRQYLATRLEGIVEAPLNLCVAVDLRPRDEAVLGSTVQPESVRASAVCAVQNLWIAARVEGLGVGWVSIVEPAVLRSELGLPPGVEPIAYLCVGHPRAFRARPMLEETGWLPRRPVSDVIHRGSRWNDSVRGERANDVRSTSRHDEKAPQASPIPAYCEQAAERSKEHQLLLTKPPRSLGRLEEIAAWYAGARGVFPVETPKRATLAVFAADHGVVVEGVSAYGSAVTAAMAATMLAGGAAVNVLARQRDVRLVVVDAGIASDMSLLPREPVVRFVKGELRRGTENLRRRAAMSIDDVDAALALGAKVARDCIEEGADVLLVGEVGIGNTTSAAAIIAAMTGADPATVAGRGTGIPDEGVVHKVNVVRDALARQAHLAGDARSVAASVGGLELVAMAGFMLEGARHRVPTILDGYLSGAAALIAAGIDKGVVSFLLASHASAERGHGVALERLGLRPLLDLGLALGEGTGALLALDLLRSSIALQREMATFATAGVVGRAGTDLPREG